MKPFRLRMSTGLLAGVITGHLMLVPLLLWGVLFIVERGYQDQFVDGVRSQAHLLSTLLSGAGSDEQMRGILDDSILAGRIRYAEIWEDGNPSHIHLGDHVGHSVAQEDFQFGEHGDQFYHVVLRVARIGDDTPVNVLLAYDELPTRAQIGEAYSRSIVVVLAFLLLVFILALIFARALTKPLADISRLATRVSDGFSDQQLHVETHFVEVHSLTETLNQMRERLVHQSQTLEHQASHDALTNLPNRVLYEDRVDQSLANAQRLGHGLVVALLDLDHFKEINDSLGHASGDLVLREIASRLRHVVRDSDTIARLGGDEFALLLHDSNSAGALAVAQNIHSTLREAVHVDGQALHVEASIGIAVYPEHGADYDTLLRRADIAMYAAKQRRQGVLLYDSKMEASKIGRLVVATELRTAIYNGQLTLCYQPKVDIKTGRLAGVEALVRWQHPVRGTIPPSEFIPVAEQTNLIQPLTQWVLQEATGQMQRWRDNGLDIPVAINLSARCLAEDQILRDVADVLKRLPPTGHGLTLEITESALMADAHRARELLTALRSMDVRISIDDFGTGFSSLAYLAKLPVNELKIDRGFVTGMLEDKSSKTIVGTVIAMAHELNLRVVAEGVESRKVLDALTTLGCDFAQGYYFGKPIPAEALIRCITTAGCRELHGFTLVDYPRLA